MSIKFEAFKGAAGASTDNLDDVTSRGSSTTNSITVGGVTIGTEYSLPSADGSPDQYIKSDGAGNLSFASLDITGGLVYQGSFNATTGTTSLGTTLANAEKGDFYLIDTAGTIYGKDWNVGDHLLINADMGGSITNSKIDKIDNTETTATEDVAGVIEIATNAEATAASATNKALVPSNIQHVALSSFNNDLSYLSSGDNISLLNNNSGYLTDITNESLNNLSDVSYTAGAGIDNYVLTYDHSTTSWGAEAAASGGLAEVVDDTTPQLGGDLDVNGNAITSASNANVVINPNGTGDISIGADLIPDADGTHTIGDEDNRYVSYYGDMNGAIRFKAKNNEGGQIQKGQAVYISGISGTVPEVQLAQANSSATMPAFGLAFATANDQADIEIITFGNLTAYDTTTYSLAANDTVFVSETTAGALTNSAPTGEANLIQNIGRVVKASATEGIIKVGGAGRSNATPNLNDGKIFLGNASNQSTPTAINTIALSSFNDDLSYLSSGDNISLLNNNSGYLTSISSESLNDLSDVSYTAGAGIDNYVLTYDHSTTSWGAEAASGGGSAPTVTTPATLTADYTISTNSGIREIFAFTSAANRAITLPTASTVGEGYQYDIKSLSSVTFTITCAGSDTIDDGSSTTFELTDQYSSITLVADSDNNRWFIV